MIFKAASKTTDARRGRRSRLRRWAGRCLIGGGIALVLLLAVGWWLLRPHRLAGLVEGYLGSRIKPAVRIERAHLSFDGSLVLESVTLSVPNAPPGARRLFEASRLTLQLDGSALWRGAVRIEAAHLRRPVLHLIQDEATGRFNYEHLPAGPGGAPSFQQGVTLPAIDLVAGRVQLGRLRGGDYQPRGSLRVAGALSRPDATGAKYQFVLRQLRRPTQAGTAPAAATQPGQATPPATAPADSAPRTKLSGTLNTKTPAVSMTLERFRFQGVQRYLLPRRFRRWWDRLEPSGALPTVRLRIAPGADGTLTLQEAALRVEALALTIPPEALPRSSDYAPRMRDVSGRFVMRDETIRVAELTGCIEGIRYHMRGTIRGFAPDAPFTWRARTEAFTVPADPPYLLAMPDLVQQQYRLFDPKGRFRASVRLHRKQPGGHIERRGLVEMLDASMRFQEFPYPVHHVRGRVHINNRRIKVNLAGEGPGGARLRMHGLRIAPARDGGGANLTLTARDVPINEALLQAMNEKQRQAMRLIFSRPGRKQLIDRGVLMPAGTAEPSGADEHGSRNAGALGPQDSTEAGGMGKRRPRSLPVSMMADTRAYFARGLAPLAHATQLIAGDSEKPREATPIPDFRLGGRIPWLRIHLHRPVGEGKQPVSSTIIGTRGLRAIFRYWPYPLTSRGGRIVIHQGRVDVEGLELAGPTGAMATINGRIDTAERSETGGLDPRLQVRNVSLPVDPLLTGSLPAPQHQWLKKLHLTGRLAGRARVFRREDGKIDFAFDGSLRDGTARPYGGRYQLSGVQGRVALSRARLTLHELTGRRGATRLSMRGEADWRGKGVGFDMRFDAERFGLSRAALDLLPPNHPLHEKLTGLYQRHQPAGRVDGTLTLTRPADKPNDSRAPAAPVAATDYRLTINPDRLAFDYQGHRYRLRKMNGRAVIEPGKLTFRDLAGRHASGRFQTSGLITLNEPAAALSFTGRAKRIGPALRHLLPERLVAGVEHLGLRGRFAIPAGRLAIDGQGGFNLETRITLADLAADVGLPVTDLDGQLDVRAQSRTDSDWPDISLDLNAETLRAWDRRLGPLRARLATAKDEPAWLGVDSLVGRFAGGRVVGEGGVSLADGAYRARLSLHQVALAAVTGPASPVGDPPGSEAATGRLTARLTLADDSDPATPRRGRGAMQVRTADLFRQPLALALLKTANLSLPMPPASFDRAAARFVLRGRQVRLGLVRLETPTLALLGRGTMQLPEQRLDLTLFSRNPRRVELGPLSEIVNAFKDELVGLKVTGTLSNPAVRPVSFQGLLKTGEALLQGRHPLRRPARPRRLPFQP